MQEVSSLELELFSLFIAISWMSEVFLARPTPVCAKFRKATIHSRSGRLNTCHVNVAGLAVERAAGGLVLGRLPVERLKDCTAGGLHAVCPGSRYDRAHEPAVGEVERLQLRADLLSRLVAELSGNIPQEPAACGWRVAYARGHPRLMIESAASPRRRGVHAIACGPSAASAC